MHAGDPSAVAERLRPLALAFAGLALLAPAAEAAPGFEALLQRANEYTLREWYPREFQGRLTDFGERGVRPAAGQALALATGARAGLYPPRHERRALAAARSVLAELARTHRSWGGQWQSALWASEAGLATLLVRDRLPSPLRLAVGRMVVAEANRFIGYSPPYYRRHGEIVSPGDSKSEENSWNAQVLAVALAGWPCHPNRREWARNNRELIVSSLARPQDAAEGPYRGLLRGGSNVNSDYGVTNHGTATHPDYAAATLSHTGFQAIAARLGGRRTPREALLNHPGIYRRVTRSYLPDGSVLRGADPFTAGRPPFAFAEIDLLASRFGYGGREAARWQRLHLRRTLASRNEGAAPYGEAWNRALVSSSAARAVLHETRPAGRGGFRARRRCRNSPPRSASGSLPISGQSIGVQPRSART